MSSGRKRMELPKKKEDLNNIVEEVERTHGHEEEHEHNDIEDVVSVLELLVDSLNANIKSLDSTVKAQGKEIANIYKVLARIVDACTSDNDEEKVSALKEAISILNQ
ncbi:MAG: hypothetical protein G5Z42_02985 [Caldisphaeraceae archaeon]|nr:hypothetical protein [Caldisphaeraceae archaeon]MEB3691831.1 hypothetical protein [Caldisphaeraceae archaeon]MEB3797771.1 hypothetical protein [Caldisphaeraceae archaeon]